MCCNCLSDDMPVTDANGQVQTTLTVESGASGPYRITAWARDREGGKEFDDDIDFVRFNVTVGVGNSPSSRSTNTGPLPPEPDPTVFFRISGDNQSGVVGQPLAKPFVVGTRDRGGDSLEGIAVTFRVLTGGGSLSATAVSTDANGRAESTLTLGSEPGTNTVEVTAGGTERVLIFKAEATLPPVPTTLSIISGNNQTGVTGEALANPFVVEVRDENSNPLENVTVNFAVLTGGGMLSSTTGTTGANGQAESTLTLGSQPGTNTVEVSAANSAETVTFNAEATLPPSTPTTLSTVSDGEQDGLTDETDPLVVEVLDENGDPIEDVSVTFTISRDDGSMTTTTVTTDEDGQAEFMLPPDSDPGTYTVTASVEGIAETVTFTVAVPSTPTTLQTISDGEQDDLIVETSMDPLVVEVLDQDGDPLEDVPVTFTILGTDSSMSTTTVMTDENGRAEFMLPPDSDPGTYTVTASVVGIAETVTFIVAISHEFDLSLPAGLNLIHLPVNVRSVDGVAQTIESVSDLYDALGGAGALNWLITHDSQTQTWHGYFGDADRGSITDRTLIEEAGILASLKTPISIQLGGDALGTDGTSTVTLGSGLNVVGLPLRDPRIIHVSDLLTLEGISGNLAAIVVTDNGEFKLVGRPGDLGDIPITGGQSFILIAQQAGTVTISGDGWDNTGASAMAAPPMMMGRIQTTGITPVLGLSGSIVGSEREINGAGLRVTVKNLSTGSAVTTVVGDADSTSLQAGYKLTVVDIENGRAAAIGDILEISVTSPDASIGVEPLQYTVTAEDVRRSRIELPSLVLQEIPTETELLRNYPNPFNPETWIPYRLAEDAFVTLTIYDGNGQVVRTLDVGHRTAAAYESQSKAAYWDGRNDLGESVASGIYFYTLTVGDYSATRKMLILK